MTGRYDTIDRYLTEMKQGYGSTCPMCGRGSETPGSSARPPTPSQYGTQRQFPPSGLGKRTAFPQYGG